MTNHSMLIIGGHARTHTLFVTHAPDAVNNYHFCKHLTKPFKPHLTTWQTVLQYQRYYQIWQIANR